MEFSWLGDNDGGCSGAIVCPRLENNVCGDYGLTVDAERQICRPPGTSYPIALDVTGAVISLRLWSEQGAEVDFQCFLYCTKDGQLPLIPEGAQLDHDVLAKAINATSKLQDVSLDDTVHPVSPVVVYHVSIASDDYSACNETRCELSASFTNALPADSPTCMYSFVCSRLAGNPCGEHGIELGGNPVCHENVVRNGTLAAGESLELNFWVARDEAGGEVDSKCYFFCTEDGRWPVRKSNKDLSSDIIKGLVLEELIISFIRY